MTAVSSQPSHSDELGVSLTLSDTASAVVVCTARDDPAVRHPVEADAGATAHVLRLSGMLTESTYDCVAAATCPASAPRPRRSR